MKKLEDLLKQQQELFDDHKYVTREFQDYGYRLAMKLDDLEHKALYIKLAKKEPRALLEQALSFAIDYPSARNKAKLFMWKLKELKDERAKKASKDVPSSEISREKKKKAGQKDFIQPGDDKKDTKGD